MHDIEKERANREGLASLTRMYAAQDRERTGTMVSFDDSTHCMKILDDSYGKLTVRIGSLKDGKAVHVVRFRKKPGMGVIYTFKSSVRLSDIAIEAAQIAALEQEAVLHDEAVKHYRT
jgi:hypothetical protein